MRAFFLFALIILPGHATALPGLSTAPISIPANEECISFSGTWTGTCYEEGVGAPATTQILHIACNALLIDGRLYAIGGSRSEQVHFSDGSAHIEHLFGDREGDIIHFRGSFSERARGEIVQRQVAVGMEIEDGILKTDIRQKVIGNDARLLRSRKTECEFSRAPQ